MAGALTYGEHMKHLAVVILFAASLNGGDAKAGEPKDGRFLLHEGTLAGAGDPQKITMMVDTQTGRTWMLVVVNAKPQWIALQFMAKVPDDVLPPNAP